ncbi:MAG: D-alanyl-D-alanine carboxypeptidase family protein [Oscillospiraceae bacterium]|nr:D-alanyl-D-alanine carboxypeptidase family protein [Oscillospiraceae bacterium]
MKKRMCVLFLALLLAGCSKEVVTESPAVEAGPTELVQMETLPIQTQPQTLPEVPEDTEFVRVADYIPGIYQELLYATDRNFTGQVIYDFQDAYLRYGTVKKLKAVSEDLAEMGIFLKIWDGFRPVSAQFALWEICPDARYVADPNKGFSSHSRGNTVDLTLVDTNGIEFPMPTGFDDFSAKADRDYSDCTEEQRNNAVILELIMEKHGFTGYAGEWWHYTDTDSYSVEENFDPE